MAEKKEFKAGVYALFAGIAVAAILVLITIFAFTTRYTAFDPEKVAQAYVDTIVQTGDGYNAYKNTLVSKNAKFGNFIIDAYMKPYVNDGDDVKQAEFVGTGSEQEATALDHVYTTMYAYYVELLNTYGLDDYDAVFSNYFAKLSEVRKDVYGDEYMDTDYMFGAFESNVSTYGKSLTGMQRLFASDDKTIIQEQETGIYQTMFGTEQEVDVDVLGEDGKKSTVKENQLVYKFKTTVKECTPLSDDEVKAYVDSYAERISPVAQSGEAKADAFGLEDRETEKKILFFTKKEKDNKKSDMISAFEKLDCSDSIGAVSKCVVEVTLDGSDEVVATQEVFVVQIGNSWYVDDTNVDTSALYLAK